MAKKTAAGNEGKQTEKKLQNSIMKNHMVEITIDDIGSDGEGIGKYEGYTLFVKDAVVGDVVRAKVLKMKKTYGYAKIEEFLEKSRDRVEPECPVAAKCGGCQLQQLSYEKQLEYKQKKVKNCLQRIGGVPEEKLEQCMEPIIGMEELYHYRNKAQFPVGVDRDGKMVMGFYAGHSHTIIPQLDCTLLEPVNADILRVLQRFFERFHVSAYQEEFGTGVVRHVLTRVGAATREIMVCLVVNVATQGQNHNTEKKNEKVGPESAKWWTEGKEVRDILVPELLKVVDGYVLTSVCININTENTNVILGDTVLSIYGETYIRDSIGEIQYQISPLSFYQVNPKQTVKLYQKALEYAELTGNETVWDLYCGIGTISLFLAQKAKQVYGVEIVPQAIEDAKRNAALNQMGNVEFFVGAAEEVMPQKYKESNGSMRADVIVVDPPRKGCEESLLETVVVMEPKRIVYVSCDPATLARDVKYLGEQGYELEKVCAVDQFGHTVHVETVCLLSKKCPV